MHGLLQRGAYMIANWLGATGAVCCLAAALSGSAHAAVTEDNFQLRNAGDLVAVCSADPSDRLMTAAVNFCHGFAIGVLRTLQDQQTAMRSKLFCITEPPPTRSETITRFVEWAKSRPDVLQQKPEDAVLAYLRAQFPCAARR
ncbi:MAG TPA: Rap1a/Tai family immunity protein [Acetobacteraceae bacterium]|nr:Rap1a/Tai family immunity protein [Acetobacteraceae bacterium]